MTLTRADATPDILDQDAVGSSWLARLPSPNARILVTLLIALFTAARYILSGIGIGGVTFAAWEPSEGWLVFVAAMSGLDLATFYAKRKTNLMYMTAHQPTVSVQQADVTATSEAIHITTQAPEPGTTVTRKKEKP